MTKVGDIRKIMVLWQAVFLAASPLVTAPPSNLTRLYYNGSAAKSHSSITQYRQLRRLKDDKASEKPIETTAKSSFTSFLASGASFLGREAAKQATNSRPVPRHIKIGRRTFLKFYCGGRTASRKTPGSGLLSIFPGKCRTFRKCIEQKLAWLKMKTARRK